MTHASSTAGAGPRRGAIVVVVEDHFVRTPEGVFATYACPYPYWQHYLEVFDEVRPLARVAWSQTRDPSWVRADGPGVRFVDIPEFRGFRQLVRRFWRNLFLMRDRLQGDYFLLMGGNVSALAWFWLKLGRVPYARAVIGHEREAVALLPDIQKYGLARIMADLSDWLGRVQVRGACCVNYWSRQLRAAYPPPSRTPNFIIPEIELGGDVMVGPRAADSFVTDPLRMIAVGRMYPEKGYRVLLDALKRLDESGERRWTLEIVGPGPELEVIRGLVATLGMADRVRCPGPIAWGPDLFARLDQADLFVMPSIGGEGMPRALLEAMARGLPALVTTVGGMPDIVDPPGVVPAGDSAAFAAGIRGYIGNRIRLAERSRECFGRAHVFHPSEVRERRHRFWGHLREWTDRWRERTQRNGVAKLATP